MPGFERFWKAYPAGNSGLKGSKKKAREYWLRDKLEPSTDDLLATLAEFQSSPQWRDGVIPYPQKWLNQRFYESPPEDPARDNGRIPPGHPCHGHHRGDTWEDAEGTKHHIDPEGYWWRRKLDCEREKREKVL